MKADGQLPGLPGGEPVQQMQIVITKELRLHHFLVHAVDPLPDGGAQITLLIPNTGELVVIPLGADAAEKLGKQLLAPRLAVADASRPNGLHLA